MSSGGPVVLVVTRVFDVDRETLFDAWTKPALMMKWFHSHDAWTTPLAEADLRVGGRWSIEMRTDDGRAYRPFGVYRVIERPSRLTFTWHPFGNPEYETSITLRFRAMGPKRTELRLTQEGLRDDADRRVHQGGWEGCLRVLAAETVP